VSAPSEAPTTATELEADEARGPSLSFSREAWRRFKKRRRALVALGVLLLMFVVGGLAPFLAGTRPIVCRYKGKIHFPALAYYGAALGGSGTISDDAEFMKDRFYGKFPASLKKNDPDSWAVWPLLFADPYDSVTEGYWTIGGANEDEEEEADKNAKVQVVPGFEKMVPAKQDLAPCAAFPFGTDEHGRSIVARMVHGTLIALLVGFVSTSISATIGFTLGSLAGYAGGWPDLLLSRVMDIVLSIPTLILILALVAVIEKPTIWQLMTVIGCTGWVQIARLTRGEVLKLRELDWVTAARALGFGPARIIARHVLPNALAPALVFISFGVAGAILTESSLSFLGFGVQPPTPSWGSILHDGFKDVLANHWWLIVFPGLGVFVGVFTYNVIGDEYQQAIDPRLR
jgi:peptide/nickel transport system permease protein